jgi:hypothetical protein
VRAAAEALGLLRGFEGKDISFSIEYDATGSMLVQGQMTKVPRYRSSIRFDVPGMRVDYDLSDAPKPQRHIDVVAASFAWNEDVPGAGLANNDNYGTATPVPSMYTERLLQFWMHPWAAIKAALKSPAKVKVSTQDGHDVLTIPLAAPLQTVALTVTLDADHRPQRVEARLDGKVFEADYSDYQDFEPQNTCYLPGHIVQKRDGQVVSDLKVSGALSYNPYVIFPIPQSVKR